MIRCEERERERKREREREGFVDARPLKWEQKMSERGSEVLDRGGSRHGIIERQRFKQGGKIQDREETVGYMCTVPCFGPFQWGEQLQLYFRKEARLIEIFKPNGKLFPRMFVSFTRCSKMHEQKE